MDIHWSNVSLLPLRTDLDKLVRLELTDLLTSYLIMNKGTVLTLVGEL